MNPPFVIWSINNRLDANRLFPYGESHHCSGYCQVKWGKMSSAYSCGTLHGCAPASPTIVIVSLLRSSVIPFGYISASR